MKSRVTDEPIEHATSTELTGGAGFTYEDTVVAYYLAALLREEGAAPLNGIVKTVAVQQAGHGHPMDDIIVELDEAGSRQTLSLQVKRKIQISAVNKDFAEIISRALATRANDKFNAELDAYVQLGWLPRLQITQTSERGYGQIYVGAVNWLLMIVTLTFAVIASRSGSSAAYARLRRSVLAAGSASTSAVVVLTAVSAPFWRGLRALALTFSPALAAVASLRCSPSGSLPSASISSPLSRLVPAILGPLFSLS